jgi:hypothetical protein
MDARTRELCDEIGRAVVEDEAEAIHRLLAPWVAASMTPQDLRTMIAAEMEWVEHPPHSWTVGEGYSELEDLRTPEPYGQPVGGVSAEVTPENFRGWISIQFAPDPSVHEEQNVCFDLWLVPVEIDGVYRVGHLEAAEAT